MDFDSIVLLIVGVPFALPILALFFSSAWDSITSTISSKTEAQKKFYSSNLKKQLDKQCNFSSMYESVLNGRLINAFDSNLSFSNLNVSADIQSDDHCYQNVTLLKCSCKDFQIHKVPCKHMLFLAYDLGILQSGKDAYEESLKKLNEEIKERKIQISQINFFKKRIETQEQHIAQERQEIENKQKKLEEQKEATKARIRQKQKELLIYEENVNRRIEQYRASTDARIDEYIKLKCSGYPQLAGMMADFLTLRYENSARFLEKKQRPALIEAERIRELRAETKKIINHEKQLEYKLAYIEKLFPNINDIFDDGFNEQEDFALETEENTDRTRLFLSPEEYQKLSVTQRNQLALDRYVQNRKSKWQVGRDYEMYIGYCIESQGYNVKYNGIIENLEDMGRDLIAEKDKYIYIVQCKNWSHEKTIHEKHIFQLYGTVILYKLENPFFEIKGVFVTTTKLSDKAKAVAKELDIQVFESLALKEFPRIKCNINRTTGEKIYHLPFDQQYDNTVINKNEGEIYAFTVAEAENNGFRRAWRHFQ